MLNSKHLVNMKVNYKGLFDETKEYPKDSIVAIDTGILKCSNGDVDYNKYRFFKSEKYLYSSTTLDFAEQLK